MVVPLTTDLRTFVVFHWVLQSDGCTNGVLMASGPVDVAAMGSVVLRDMVFFVEAPHLIHFLVRSRMGQLLLAGKYAPYRHAAFLSGHAAGAWGSGKINSSFRVGFAPAL